MSLAQKLSDEYIQVKDTDFWKLFINELEKRRARNSRDCETLEDPRKAQGAVFELNVILGRNEAHPLWEKSIEDALKKLDTKETR